MKGFVKIDRAEIDDLMRLGSSTLKLYLCMLAKADYRTGEYAGSYRILMAETGLSRSTICAALRELRSEKRTEPVQFPNSNGLEIRLSAFPYTAKKEENNTHTATADDLIPTREQLESYAATCGFLRTVFRPSGITTRPTAGVRRTAIRSPTGAARCTDGWNGKSGSQQVQSVPSGPNAKPAAVSGIPRPTDATSSWRPNRRRRIVAAIFNPISFNKGDTT